jgi:hypothetical protein
MEARARHQLSPAFMLCLFLNHEDKRDMFLRNGV